MELSCFALLTAEEWTALRLSLQVAVCAALAGLPFAVGIGYLLARASFSGKWLVETLVHLPLVLPPVVTGYLLLVCFAPRGPVGSLLADWFGVRIVFSWLGAVLASAVVGFPLLVRAIRLAFQGVDRRLEMAARSLGASRISAFFTISLPLARRGVIAGWLLAFARSLGEFGATIIVAGNIPGLTQTLPLAIYTAITTGNERGALTLSLISVALAVLLVLVLARVEGSLLVAGPSPPAPTGPKERP
jgi:molybdate transport system permease protein